MKGLRLLNLLGTKVTDAGLKVLSALNRLQTVDVRGTEVAEGGVQEWRKALPGCHVYGVENTATADEP